MIRDLFVGLVLIFYTFSVIGCYELTVAAILDSVEHYDAALAETFALSFRDRFYILLFSLLPIVNTMMAALIGYHYNEFVAMVVEGVEESREELEADDVRAEQDEPSTTDSI